MASRATATFPAVEPGRRRRRKRRWQGLHSARPARGRRPRLCAYPGTGRAAGQAPRAGCGLHPPRCAPGPPDGGLGARAAYGMGSPGSPRRRVRPRRRPARPASSVPRPAPSARRTGPVRRRPGTRPGRGDGGRHGDRW